MNEKNMFGKAFAFKTEVTNGTCPMCSEHTVLVSLYKNVYRCINCGADTEQKVNGVISFMPISPSGSEKPEIKLFTDGT
jgi:uncharacterized protein (DUF983 family)